MTCPWSGEARVMIDNLPSGATDDYLWGMMAMVSMDFTSILVESEEREGMTGFVTFTSASEAERIIEALDGISNGAMAGKVLKVEWAVRRQKRLGAFGSPDAKKPRTRAWSSPSEVEASDLFQASDPFPQTLANTLTKFPPPSPLLTNYSNRDANFVRKIKLIGLQNLVLRTREPDPRRLAYQSPGAALMDFLCSKIFGPDGANLFRLSKEGAQVGVRINSALGVLDPSTHILIKATSHAQLLSVSQQVDDLLEAVADDLLGWFLCKSLFQHET
jgi:hypothetical protein